MGAEGGRSAPGRLPEIFTLHAVWRRGPEWERIVEGQRERLVDEVEAALGAEPGVEVRGVYSSVGFRPDADILFWLLAPQVESLQRTVVALRHTTFGRASELSWSFLGVARPPQFVGDHLAAFQRGIPPKRYVQVYPFVRTPEWYLLPTEERARMLREHGRLGAEFPEVYTNNVQAFGLGDYEWILAFETDDFSQLVDLIRRLREAEARRYTKLDVPFILGVRKPLAEALADLA
ncbi:MAG: chlorite dismutase family protein [Firmicutes bacterium]|nr:chlorite dismutase family protein [Bacillota bacterium]